MDDVTTIERPRVMLPAEAPLAMPEQDLRAAAPRAATPGNAMLWRRIFVIGGAVLLTAFLTAEMSRVLGLARWTTVGGLLTALYAVLLIWIALAFTTALGGVISVLTRERGLLRDGDGAHRPATRTALLVPVHNEDVAALARSIGAMRAALHDSGAGDAFDIFILSDTTDGATRDAERALVQDLRARRGPAVFHRLRAQNTARKAGNIADWVRRFGGAYEQFLILDADSLMEAGTLLALVAIMERNPRAGLVQTLPLLEGGQTLFARLQQFASQVYGPIFARGIAWWHGGDSNYWGHNAMIRTRAFAENAGLPELDGAAPFGGAILSHDFVEAALMRRAGWSIHLLPQLGGSFERGPPTLDDLSVRDRRWFQGNLQHVSVVGAARLHPLSRFHMVSGIAAYACAPLWLMFLLIGLLTAVQSSLLRPDYFPEGYALFPVWPVFDDQRAVWVLAGTMLLLLAPKIIGLCVFLASAQRPRGVAATLRFAGSAVIEILASALLSPVTMLTQSAQWVGVLRGRDAGWKPQRRDGGGARLGPMARRMWAHVGMGLALGGAALLIDPLLCLWMLPVVAGLLLAPVLSVATSSVALSDRLRDAGLFVTPSDLAPGPVLRQARAGN
jgi:membrane glycosyltransferase